MKKIDWNKTYKEPFQLKKGLNNQNTHNSIRERLAEGFQKAQEMEALQKKIDSWKPLMKSLLQVKIDEGSVVEVRKSFTITADELIETTQGAHFSATQKPIHAGEKLLCKGYNPTLQCYVFESNNGNVYEIFNTEEDKIYLNSDIYETVSNYYEGE